MTEVTTVQVQTNTKPNSCKEVVCDCPTMWSLVQQECYRRLSDEVGTMTLKPIKNYAVRAKRIAGTYAKFYLEEEMGGDLKKKGRFYWMALACFASKTVACTLERWQVYAPATVGMTAVKEGLGKGNFWLFQDIAGWHLHYSLYGDSFEMCRDTRDTSTYAKNTQALTKAAPWSAQALPKINNLKVTSYITDGFAKVKQIETEINDEEKRKFQLAHLLIIADHEQKMILQPLIYDDPDFSKWVQRQRYPLVKSIAPDLELIFAKACETDDIALKSEAPGDTKLEEFRSRMKWITHAAEQFHDLMGRRRAYMEGEITKMAGWYNMADE